MENEWNNSNLKKLAIRSYCDMPLTQFEFIDEPTKVANKHFSE